MSRHATSPRSGTPWRSAWKVRGSTPPGFVLPRRTSLTRRLPPLEQLHGEIEAEQLAQVGPVADAVVDEHEVVGAQPELLARDRGRQIGAKALVIDARGRELMRPARDVELVELLGDHRDRRCVLHQARVVSRVDEVVGAELVLSLARQAAQGLVRQAQGGREQVLLVVLEVHDVGRVERPRRPLGGLPDHLARSPGADDRLVGIPAPLPELPVELPVVDAGEAGLADRGDPARVALAAEHHLDARRRSSPRRGGTPGSRCSRAASRSGGRGPSPDGLPRRDLMRVAAEGRQRVVGRVAEEAPAVVGIARARGARTSGRRTAHGR